MYFQRLQVEALEVHAGELTVMITAASERTSADTRVDVGAYGVSSWVATVTSIPSVVVAKTLVSAPALCTSPSMLG